VSSPQLRRFNTLSLVFTLSIRGIHSRGGSCGRDWWSEERDYRYNKRQFHGLHLTAYFVVNVCDVHYIEHIIVEVTAEHTTQYVKCDVRPAGMTRVYQPANQGEDMQRTEDRMIFLISAAEQ